MTTLFDQAVGQTASPIDARPARKNRSWLPLLTVLFLISYGLMTMLIVEQGSTIESQRVLIRELFRDSAELSATKMKAQQDKTAADAHTQLPATKAQTSTPSVQAPSKTPSSQAVPQHRTQSQPRQFQMPSRPASDLQDDRRALITI